MSGFRNRSNIIAGGISAGSKGASRFPLSNSPSGMPIDITTSGVLLHDCVEFAMDEVYLWASNYNASDTAVTMSFGDTTTGDSDSIILTLTGQNGLYLIYPGIPHIGTKIFAKAASNSRINIVGFVIRRFREDQGNRISGYDGSS